MESQSEYIGLLVAAVLSVTIACLIILLNKWLGPKNKGSAVKSEPFECGVEPFEIKINIGKCFLRRREGNFCTFFTNCFRNNLQRFVRNTMGKAHEIFFVITPYA